MPVRSEEQYIGEVLSNRGFAPEPPRQPKNPLEGAVGPSTAAFGESFLGKVGIPAYEHFFGPTFNDNPDYDPYDDIIADGLIGWGDYLKDASSRDEYQYRKSMVDMSRENEMVLAESGWTGAGYQLMWGAADPVNFIPMVGIAGKTLRATKSLGATAAVSVGVGGAGQAVQEAVVAQVDPNYNVQDGLFSVGAMALLSGVIGPYAAGALDPETKAAFKQAYEGMGREDVPLFSDGTAGAAQIVPPTGGDNLVTAASLGVSRVASFIGPSTRLQASGSEAVRKYNSLINETALMTKGNLRGVASPMPVEAEKRIYMAMESETRRRTHDAYLDYRKAVAGSRGNLLTNDVKDAIGLSARAGVLTRQDFYDRIGKAMRRGDKAEFADFAEANPFIEKAAKANREMSDSILNEMIDAKLFADEPDLKGTAESWFRRMYDQQMVDSNPDAFEAGIARFYRQERDANAARLPGLDAELKIAKTDLKAAEAAADKALIKTLSKRIEDLSVEVKAIRKNSTMLDEELAGTARRTKERIQGSPMGLVEYEDAVASTSKAASPYARAGRQGVRGTKERKLTIPDTFQWEHNSKTYTFEDFLVSDPTRMQAAVTRTVVPDLLLHRRLGTLDTQQMLQEVSDDYGKMIAKAKTAKEKTRLEKARKNDLEDLRDSIAIQRGAYGNTDDHYKAFPTALRMAKQVNYLSLMGEMAISSAADIGSIVLKHGLRRTFGTLIQSFVPAFRSQLMNMAMDDVIKLAIGLESVMNDRFAKIYDADIFAPAANKIENALNYQSGVLQKVSLMNTWLDSLRPMAGMWEQDNLVALAQKVKAGKKLTKLETGDLASKYLNQDDLKIIAAQFEKHGQTETGGIGGALRVPNMRLWDVDDPAVAAVVRKMRVAIAKEVDTLVIKPGSEIPKAIKKGGAASAALQFKSFMFSATNRLLARSAQKLALGDKRLIMGITSMVALGMMAYAAKATIAGREVSKNPQDWLMEGIDRSGMLGIFGEINNITEKVTGGKIGLRPMIGGKPATRYINRNFLETLAGPTAGIVQDAGELMQAAAMHGNLTTSDLNKIRKHIPFQNAIGFRYLFDGAVDEIGDTLGLPQRR